MSYCSVEGCGRPIVTKTPPLCAKHYKRWRKHGDPSVVKSPGFAPRPRQICVFPSCAAPQKRGGRGWCGKHYTRWYRHGDPSFDGNKHRRRRDVEERIRERIRIDRDCWIWTGTRMPTGYGQIGIGNRHEYVHRAMWELRNGPVPADLVLHHICERKPCCNPDHLQAVTPFEHARLHLRGVSPQ